MTTEQIQLHKRKRKRRDSTGTGKAFKPASHIHFINTRNKFTNYTHFGSRFRAIQICSYI